MSEWFDNQNQTSSSFRKLLQERIEKANPRRKLTADLTYIAGDFFDPALLSGQFDAIAFMGSLHHFADQTRTLAITDGLLAEGGIVIAHEPARDRMTKGNAAFQILLETILSADNRFFLSRKSNQLRKRSCKRLRIDSMKRSTSRTKGKTCNRRTTTMPGTSKCTACYQEFSRRFASTGAMLSSTKLSVGCGTPKMSMSEWLSICERWTGFFVN
mgnify:CR=1 FL=1